MISRLHHLFRSQCGASLPITIGVLAGLTLLGAVSLRFSASADRSAEYAAAVSEARAFAEAGDAHARSLLWSSPDPTDPTAVGNGSFTRGHGTVSYQGTYDASSATWTLTSSGTVSNPTGPAAALVETVTSKILVDPAPDLDPLAIYAADASCGTNALEVGGTSIAVAGGVRSNGDFHVPGSNNAFGHSSGQGAPCNMNVGGIGNNFAGAAAPVADPVAQPWPHSFAPTDFGCTVTANSFHFTTSGTIPAGIYCTTGTFRISASNVRGAITVIADRIVISGSRIELEPAPSGLFQSHNVLFYATGSSDMDLSGRRLDWEGIIYHPGGRVKFHGRDSSAFSGTIEANSVEITGSHTTITGTGPLGPGTPTPTLVNVVTYAS